MSWEDSAFLQALGPVEPDHALVLEPSGDDALDLLALGAGRVTLVVPDEATQHLVALKRAAVRELPVQSVRSFLGMGHFGRRVWFYHHLRPSLAAPERAYWDAAEGSIRAGLVDAGRVEREAVRFRSQILPMVVSAAALGRLSACATADAARDVLAAGFGTRWRLATRAILPKIAWLAGAPGAGAAARFDAALRTAPLTENPYAERLLLGQRGDPDRAHAWLGAAGLARVKQRLPYFKVCVAGRAEALARPPSGVSLVVLGRRPLTDAEAGGLARLLPPGGRALAWTEARPPAVPAPLSVDVAASARLQAQDRGIFPGMPWLVRREA
jgi:hypothetical protein